MTTDDTKRNTPRHPYSGMQSPPRHDAERKLRSLAPALALAAAQLRTARVGTILLQRHANEHAEPDCEQCTEWFDVLLPAADKALALLQEEKQACASLAALGPASVAVVVALADMEADAGSTATLRGESTREHVLAARQALAAWCATVVK